MADNITFHQYNNLHDIEDSFGRYSPGILLILEAAKRWMTEGVVDFDMCRGDERYKKEMGGINEPLCRIETRV